MSRLEVRESDLGRLDKLGSGGYGTVYSLPEFRLPGHSGPLAYKKYHQGALDPHQVEAIKEGLRWQSRLDAVRRARLAELAAWPLRMVVDGSRRVAGILIPRIVGDEYFYEMVPEVAGEQPHPEPVTLSMLIESASIWQPSIPGFPDDTDVAARTVYAALLAQFVAMLHRHGFVYGDLSGANVWIGVGEAPTIQVIDCDAVHPVRSTEPNRQGGSMSWHSPEESHGAPLSMATDVYRMALAVIRIVGHGQRNAQFQNPDRVRDALGDPTVEMLRRCLDRDPARRPPAGELYEHLVGLLDGLVTTPMITSISVTPRVLIEGGNVTITVEAEHADRLTVTAPDGTRAELVGTTARVPVAGSGVFTVHAANRYRTASAESQVVTTIPMPRLTTMIVAEPVISGLDNADLAVLRRGLDAAHLSGAGLTSPLDQLAKVRADSAAFDGLLGALTEIREIISPPVGLPDMLTALSVSRYPRGLRP